ncbi:cobalamin-binding protein [Thiosulfatimonas sediminis]|uniref:Cobalamin-binding protein n=1 Tax=Thiosulfatimonas sediminis TaxID=2675054 RepID=A0A6F8PVD9_9GAMM|nr:cobalamin-binding protein [Thiosulfatimonas sediminis]BBP46103.1 cobalamin-binding protein [Thiosulfatimonas sediminis]
MSYQKHFTLIFTSLIFQLLFIHFAHAETPAQRIITLAPHLTEMVYSAGAGEKLVGVVNYSDYPAEAKSKPIVGSYNAINIERIVELKPDLVLSWRSGNRLQDYQRLEQLQQKLGFRLIESEINTLDDIPALIRQIGILAGSATKANAEAHELQTQLTQLRQQFATAKPVTVFYQIWNNPLITMGKNQFISQGIELCGGRNIFEDLGSLTGQVAVETVLIRDPEVILLGGTRAMQQDWLQTWQAFGTLQAVQNNTIFLLNNDLYQRSSARFIRALPALCAQIGQAR